MTDTDTSKHPDFHFSYSRTGSAALVSVNDFLVSAFFFLFLDAVFVDLSFKSSLSYRVEPLLKAGAFFNGGFLNIPLFRSPSTGFQGAGSLYLAPLLSECRVLRAPFPRLSCTLCLITLPVLAHIHISS